VVHTYNSVRVRMTETYNVIYVCCLSSPWDPALCPMTKELCMSTLNALL